MGKKSAVVVASLALVGTACRAPNQPREYELRGLVVSVDAPRQEITISHGDIPRFMPAMTMPFKVRDARLLEARKPGDLVRATLVVDGADAHLRTLDRTGSAPVPETSLPARAEVLAPGEAVPDAGFVDQAGERRRLSGWRGHALAVTFIYTRCPLPNFCPLMDQHFRKTQDAVARDQDLRGRVRLLSVSVDAAHDRPAVLAAHATRLGADPAVWSFLTGDGDDIKEFAARLGVSVLPDEGDTREIVHNLRTAIIDPEGRLSSVLGGNEWSPQDLIAELRKARAAR